MGQTMSRDGNWLQRPGQVTGQSRRMSRRGALRMMGAAAAIPAMSSLASCGSSSPGGGNTDTGKGTLSLAYLGDASQQAAFNALFAAFNKSHPGITIKANGIAAGDWATFANT